MKKLQILILSFVLETNDIT